MDRIASNRRICRLFLAAAATAGLGFSQLPPASSNVNRVCHGLEQSPRPQIRPGWRALCSRRRTWVERSPLVVVRSGCAAYWAVYRRINRPHFQVDSSGNRTTVVDGLPSSQTERGSGGLVSGVADVAFVGSTMYALLAGAGCSHGVAGTPNGVITVNKDGSWSVFADLSTFVASNPVANPSSPTISSRMERSIVSSVWATSCSPPSPTTERSMRLIPMGRCGA